MWTSELLQVASGFSGLPQGDFCGHMLALSSQRRTGTAGSELTGIACSKTKQLDHTAMGRGWLSQRAQPQCPRAESKEEIPGCTEKGCKGALGSRGEHATQPLSLACIALGCFICQREPVPRNAHSLSELVATGSGELQTHQAERTCSNGCKPLGRTWPLSLVGWAAV